MIGSTDDDDPARELRRVVDRLGALGPERVARPGPDGAVPVEVVLAELDLLATEAADLRGDDHRVLPSLGPHALGDQLVVLVGEALEAGADPQVVGRRLARLRRVL